MRNLDHLAKRVEKRHAATRAARLSRRDALREIRTASTRPAHTGSVIA